jgi:hypothetical protein
VGSRQRGLAALRGRAAGEGNEGRVRPPAERRSAALAALVRVRQRQLAAAALALHRSGSHSRPAARHGQRLVEQRSPSCT